MAEVNKLDSMLTWYTSLSENWQIAIFTVAVPSILGTLFIGLKKILLLLKLEAPQNSENHLSEKLSMVSGNIRELLSEYTVELESVAWKPHISTSNREFCISETSRIEAQINEKFKKHFEQKSLSLLKRASIILNKTDFNERTKILTGVFLLNEYCDYLNEAAEELRVVEKI